MVTGSLLPTGEHDGAAYSWIEAVVPTTPVAHHRQHGPAGGGGVRAGGGGDARPVAALADDGSEPSRVAVVGATLVKGLEFDHVVVVEPAAIVAAEPRGLHRLYVALTRAVSSLVVLHRGELPELLAGEG